MIVPIAAAIAATVSRAIILTPSPETNSMFPLKKNGQIQGSSDLSEFLTQLPLFFHSVVQPSPVTCQTNVKIPPPPLPESDDALELLGFDLLYPPLDFQEVRRAYKRMVKMYHPDAVTDVAATAQQKQEASRNFARITSAFESLKKRENERVEMVGSDDDVVQVQVTGEDWAMRDGSRRRDYLEEVQGILWDQKIQQQQQPHYQQQQQQQQQYFHRQQQQVSGYAEQRSLYRRCPPRRKMWYEEEYRHQPRHNGFRPEESAHDQGLWWTERGNRHSHHYHSRSMRRSHNRDDAGSTREYSYNQRYGKERWHEEVPRYSSTGYAPFQEYNEPRFNNDLDLGP